MSSVREAGRVLGLASSAITAITSAEEIYIAAFDASGLPKEIRAVAAQLPLASNVLRAAKTTFEANQNHQTTALVEPVFDLCQSNGTKLLFIFDKVVPVEDDASHAERLRKVLHTLGKTRSVEDLILEIFESLLQLQANATFTAAIDAARLRAAQDELNRVGDGASESYSNHGTRSMSADITTTSPDASMEPHYYTSTQGSLADLGHRHVGIHQGMIDGADYCARISQFVNDEYNRAYSTSSRYAVIEWEFPEFVAECLGGDTDLGDVFTVTGTADVACGTTCRQYILELWGHVGIWMLDMLCSTLNRNPKLLNMDFDGMRVELEIFNDKCEASFSKSTLSEGDLSNIAVAIQTLAWMTSVFRMPKRGVPCCSEQSFHNEDGLLFVWLESLRPVTTKKCWHDIVPNTTIASGFPTGVKENSGLDIKWEVMLDLADMLFQTDLSKISSDQSLSKTRDGSSTTQGIFYSGVGTLLYPIKRYIDPSRDQSVYEWHFDATGQSALPPEDTVLPPCNEDEFARSRHLLGFAPRNEVRLGTQGRAHEYRRMHPVAGCMERSVPEISIENISTNLGKAPLTVTLGSKIKYSQPLRGTKDPEKRRYDSILKAAERQAVILCDVGPQKKSWLVSQISVILDLVCYRIQKEGWTGLPKYATPQADGGAAAAEILRDADVYITLLTPGLAGDEDFKVFHLVKEIYLAMQERQRLREMSVRGIIRLHRKLLHSWDLLELADSPDEYSRRATAVHTTSSRVVAQYPSWLPLAYHVPVYSGQNLGDVMTVAGRPIVLQEAAPGEKYLMANVHAMHSLVQTTPNCSHCHLHGGLVLTLPLRAVRERKLSQGDCNDSSFLEVPDACVQTLTKERDHTCEGQAGSEKLQSDGLVVFGPEQKRLLVKLNDWADANMPAH